MLPRLLLLIGILGVFAASTTLAFEGETQSSPIDIAGTGSIGSGGNGKVATSISTYTKINDQASCRYREFTEPSGAMKGCAYHCVGPVQDVSTHLFTCGDWDHLWVQIGEKRYSTWRQMITAGNFAGFSNKKGVVEWVGIATKKGFSHPFAMIVRFMGSNSDGEPNHSKLFVYGIEKGALCFKAETRSNKEARHIARFESCTETIEPEKN